MDEEALATVHGTAAFLYGGSRSGSELARFLTMKALSSVSPDRKWLAAAWKHQLAIGGLPAEVSPSTSYHGDLTEILGVGEFLTALAWLAFSPSQSPGSASLPETVLLVGTSLGYLHLHATSGRLIHRQRLHATACCSVQVRNRGQGLDERDASEDVTVGFADAVARISVFELQSLMSHAARATPQDSVGSMEPLMLDTQLTISKWDLNRAGRRSCALCLGARPASLFERMSGRIPSPKLSVLTVGKNPAVAMYEAPEWGNEGVLAIVSELASGVAGLAKTLARGRENGYRAGLGSWLGRRKPTIEGLKVPPDKVPTPQGQSSTLWGSVSDQLREVTSMSVAPRGPLAAAADNLGRVLLIDTWTMTVIRLWKSYRNAQMAWLTFPATQDDRAAVLLVLYSSKLARIEIWRPRSGAPILSLPACQQGILFHPPAAFGPSGAVPSPCLLDCANGTLTDVGSLLEAHREPFDE